MTTRDLRSSEAGVSIGDLYGVFRRRLWWFLAPTLAGLVIALGLALGLPALYEATATVTVEPPS